MILFPCSWRWIVVQTHYKWWKIPDERQQQPTTENRSDENSQPLFNTTQAGEREAKGGGEGEKLPGNGSIRHKTPPLFSLNPAAFACNFPTGPWLYQGSNLATVNFSDWVVNLVVQRGYLFLEISTTESSKVVGGGGQRCYRSSANGQLSRSIFVSSHEFYSYMEKYRHCQMLCISYF